MERLTFEGNFCDIAQCDVIPGGSSCESGSCTQRKVWERLKAYEDRGCAPEEVLPKDKADEIALKLMRLADLESICSYTRLCDLAEADKDGRLVVLPCKVGDTVYHVSRVRTSHFEDDKIIIDDEGRLKIYEMPFTLIHLPYIGKSYFLTREEAEKAVEAMKK